ncbi:hypothetical protein [Entomomonas moraniae]|uniref:hypothetical protein n=1 Tax=Entomomonas moraniae TaxID=2213226 RepID=UPI0013DF0409|nr:hypothetical protein [Entomomonas moraniae]
MKKLVLACLCLGFSINCFADNAINPKGLWVNRVTTDQIDDTKTFYAYLPSPT